jgi:hypothetical protein
MVAARWSLEATVILFEIPPSPGVWGFGAQQLWLVVRRFVVESGESNEIHIVMVYVGPSVGRASIRARRHHWMQ